MHAQDDDPGRTLHFLCARRHLDAAQFRHRNVQNQQIGVLLLAESDGFEAVRRLCDNGDVGGLEQSPQAPADDGVIVSEQHSQGAPP